ncbi:MAG TPA: heme o synthase [Gemmatimonadales bacterium]|nr:heme o synthase [Gemmatimonadales bacterium]
MDPKLLRRLAWTGAAFTFLLIVLGGIVRITGSGLGCGEHWPNCNGRWFPPLDLPTLIEISHRWVAALVTITVTSVGIVAWLRHRNEPRIRNPATVAFVLLVVQVLLGAITVKLTLPPSVVVVHLANAMLVLAALLVTAMRASTTQEAVPAAERHPGHPLALVTAGLGFIVILFGALTANLHAGWYCSGFPLCDGKLSPPTVPLALIHWIHRLLAFTFVGFVMALAWTARRRRGPAGLRYRRMTAALLVVSLAQVAVAAAMVLNTLPPALRALHLFTGTSVWAVLVVLLFFSRRTPAVEAESAETAGDARPSVLRDLVTLTKPRIISLLLVTTIFPMFITGHGVPSVGLVIWVVIAGYLMAGGANAINMWFDRDIDDRMSRTKLRPVPSGRMPAWGALVFGMALGASSFALFWAYVNPLSAFLALAGLLFYVLVYTIWLKRWTPQNIVIGGAAGAFPPLVGWAAMAGRLDLTAIYLFAIIFYWTPPHFWALALIKQGEYAKAGIPMMPLVQGEHRTKLQMLGYTVMLLPLTLLPWISGDLGLFYAAAAVLLGARLLWYCIRLLREPAVTPTAWKMYKYSLLYLFLLFAAMGVDRAVPFGHGNRAPEVIELPAPPPSAAPTSPETSHGH